VKTAGAIRVFRRRVKNLWPTLGRRAAWPSRGLAIPRLGCRRSASAVARTSPARESQRARLAEAHRRSKHAAKRYSRNIRGETLKHSGGEGAGRGPPADRRVRQHCRPPELKLAAGAPLRRARLWPGGHHLPGRDDRGCRGPAWPGWHGPIAWPRLPGQVAWPGCLARLPRQVTWARLLGPGYLAQVTWPGYLARLLGRGCLTRLLDQVAWAQVNWPVTWPRLEDASEMANKR
jgi:hypothetical protein